MPASGIVSYKKKDGKIIIKEHNVEWTEKGSMQPALTIALSAIKSIPCSRLNLTNTDSVDLQASPASAASPSMRIFAAPSISAEPVAHTFKFTQKEGARQEMELFVGALQAAVAAKKTAVKQVSAKPSVSEILASQDVESDSGLQEALLKSNPDLANTFREAVINGSVTPTQFWSSRTHLLRAFLIEQSQQKGPYNVLSTIRPKTVDNKITVNMTREKIRDVFTQHPLLRRIYDECVPPLGEDEFWSRFFVSRLCKKLRGERVLASDPVDDKLDPYMDLQEQESRKRRRDEESVPQVINIEGNEQHNSKKMGNAPDFTMRASKTDVINSINSISLNMLDSLHPATTTPATTSDAPNDDQTAGHGLEGYEDKYYQEDIRLGDLQVEEDDPRILLNVRDQGSFFAPTSEEDDFVAHPSKKVKVGLGAPSTDPARTLSFVISSLPAPFGSLDGPHMTAKGTSDVTTATSVDTTYNVLNNLIQAQSKHQESVDNSSAATQSGSKISESRGNANGTGSNNSSGTGISASIASQMQISHASTHEFLSLFWRYFLTGSSTPGGTSAPPSAGTAATAAQSAKPLAKIVDALRRTESRVLALASRTESETEGRAVQVSMAPTLRAVTCAIRAYEAAVAESRRATAAVPPSALPASSARSTSSAAAV